MKKITITLIVICWAVLSFAEEFKRPAQGIRNLGMGNVGVALSHDENALYYNPAGLSGVDKIWVDLPILFELSQDSISLVEEIQALDSDSGVGDTLEVVLGKRIHFRTMFGLNAVVPFGQSFTFGAGYGGELQFDLSARNPILLELEAGLRLDELQAYGVAIPLGKGHWVLGLGFHVIRRCELPITNFTIDTIIANSDSMGDLFQCEFGTSSNTTYLGTPKLSSGLTYGQSYDLGIQRRIEGTGLRTTWGITANNVGGLKFSRAEGNTYPRDEPTEVSFGVSFQPAFTGVRMLYAFDIRDISLDRVDDDTSCRTDKDKPKLLCYWKRIHMGMELGIIPLDSGASFLAMRAGFNQGYFSYGLEINPFVISRFLTIQTAVYTEEVGDFPGDKPEQRKVVQISLSL